MLGPLKTPGSSPHHDDWERHLLHQYPTAGKIGSFGAALDQLLDWARTAVINSSLGVATPSLPKGDVRSKKASKASAISPPPVKATVSSETVAGKKNASYHAI